MKRILIIMGILLVATFVSASNNVTQNLTVTVLPAIHINEFEQNPFTGADWIELFNNGPFLINISGWEIYDGKSSPHLIYTFPAGTLIAPGGYPVIEVGTYLNQGGDFVTLKDENGTVIDETPELLDLHNDNRTWQRVPDALGDFFFKLSTRGLTNTAPLEITNKSNITCAYERKNVTLYVSVMGDVSTVWFSYTINNTNKNMTATYLGDSNYSVIIPYSELVGGMNVTWNVYANNTIGQIFNNSWKTFYVWDSTMLGVIPSNPDGDNGWYVTEPWFILSWDNNAGDIYYQWDSKDPILYTGPFNLTDIPNAPPVESAGVLDLHWWAEFEGCGSEPSQMELFYVDLKDTSIGNLQPVPLSTTFNRRPEISAYLEEEYQSNSGVNLSSVSILVNSVDVTSSSDVSFADTLDATVTYNPGSDLPLGLNTVEIFLKDNAGRESSISWNFNIEEYIVPAFDLFVYSPTEGIFNTRRLSFNISTSNESEKIEYTNWNDKKPKPISLCRDCDEYGFERLRTRNMNEGANNISIRAISSFGVVDDKNLTLFVDSRPPKISRTSPKRNSWANGIFEVQFKEENPEEIILYYGNDNKTASLSECYDEKGKSHCSVEVNLFDYNGSEIDYWFFIRDIANNTATSKPVKVKVDTTPPKIENPNSFYMIDGKDVYFEINITELNLERVIYIDSADSKKNKTLCSSLKNGLCKRKVSFGEGVHDLNITVFDKAGNSQKTNLSFFVDSKAPRIYKTEPRRNSFTNGSDFYVKFKEVNPEELNLVINETDVFPVNFSNISVCAEDRGYTECDFAVNLIAYNGQDTEYYFFIKDLANQTDESKPTKITVDTEPPVINNPGNFFTNDSRYIYFNINITEDNFDEVVLLYDYKGRTKERRLCSRLKEGICEKKFRYRNDYSNMSIIITDKAGNFEQEEITLFYILEFL